MSEIKPTQLSEVRKAAELLGIHDVTDEQLMMLIGFAAGLETRPKGEDDG